MTESPPQLEPKIKLADVQLKDIGQLAAAAFFVLYFCGFLVVNAYNGRLGIRDYDAFRTQYVVAGLIVFAFIGLYFSINGWSTSERSADISNFRNELVKSGMSSGRAFALSCSAWFADRLFRIVICTIIATALLVDPLAPNSLGMGALNASILLFQYYWHPKTVETKVWVISFLALGKILLVAAFMYFASASSHKFVGVFVTLWTLLNLSEVAEEKVSNKVAYRTGAVIFGLVVLSTSIGAYIFGSIKPAVGGGAPVSVRLVMADQATSEELNRVIDIHSGVSDPLLLVAETASEFIMAHASPTGDFERVVRIRRDGVRAIALDESSSGSKPAPHK